MDTRPRKHAPKRMKYSFKGILTSFDMYQPTMAIILNWAMGNYFSIEFNYRHV